MYTYFYTSTTFPLDTHWELRVSYIGPEKSKIVVPLSQEQLECQMHMMFCVLEQCHLIRRDLCNGLKDNEISSFFRRLFDRMGEHLNKTFVDLRKQEALIHDMQTNLTGLRCRCIQMFRSVYTINSKIPWLKRKLDADWISVYDTAKERRKTMTGARSTYSAEPPGTCFNDRIADTRLMRSVSWLNVACSFSTRLLPRGITL